MRKKLEGKYEEIPLEAIYTPVVTGYDTEPWTEEERKDTGLQGFFAPMPLCIITGIQYYITLSGLAISGGSKYKTVIINILKDLIDAKE